MSSWVPGAAGSGFDVDHLPYAVATVDPEQPPRVVARIGDHAVDLAPLAAAELAPFAPSLAAPSGRGLHDLMALGRPAWDALRAWLAGMLADTRHCAAVEPHLRPVDGLALHLPCEVADYVDFYCSLDHATHVGQIFRPDGEALLPNWRHLPVGYHGRAGTIVVSGTDVARPCGQRRPADVEAPSYGPTRRLDLEAEVGFWVGAPTAPGSRVATGGFADHVFGVGLLNDWSARDVQGWEYQPLGPFLGKSFATSVSAWVTPLAALETARVPLPGQDPPPLPYLEVAEPAGLDLDLEVEVDGEVIARPRFVTTYWSPAQMLAHLTSNGAALRTGDLFASGTVSGPTRGERGCLLELTWGGREPFSAGGRERTWLEDGDEVVLRASAPGALGGRLSLGEVRARILPAP